MNRRGLAYGMGAYLWWGLLPIYFKAVSHVPPVTVACHRVLWGLPLMVGLVVATRRWHHFLCTLKSGRLLRALIASSLLIAINWLVFIWAVANHRVTQASFGYYITPLMNLVLGMALFAERPTRLQSAAFGAAGLACVIYAIAIGGVPWVSLSVSISWALYGLVRKSIPVDSINGFAAECAILLPFAIAGLLLVPAGESMAATGHLGRTWFLLAGAGIVTAAPLIWFAASVKLLPLTTMGLLQYIAPTCQFLVAVLLFKEPMDTGRFGAFAMVLVALLLFTADMWHGHMKRRVPPMTPDG